MRALILTLINREYHIVHTDVLGRVIYTYPLKCQAATVATRHGKTCYMYCRHLTVSADKDREVIICRALSGDFIRGTALGAVYFGRIAKCAL